MKIKLLCAGILAIFSLNCHADGNLRIFESIDKSKISISISGGVNKLDINTSLAPNATLNTGALDKSGRVLEFGIGYKYSKKIFSTFAFQRSTFDISSIKNIYGSINYQFPIKTIQPFIGALVGYSQLDWSKRPHPMLINENLKSDSFIYGVQTGIKKKVSQNYSIFAKYQYIKYDHNIEIQNNTSNIKHNAGQIFLIGISYIF